MSGEEFFFRGFLLFGLAHALGPGPAIWLQAAMFALLHLGKPELEALGALFGGGALGLVAWQSRSFVYPFLIHWFTLAYTSLLVSARAGG